MKILLSGAGGRMGRAITAASGKSGVEIVAALGAGDDPEPEIARCEAVIDFSFHTATLPLAALAAQHGKPLVIGTTGHSNSEKESIKREAAKVPTVWAGNFSIGVNLLFDLVSRAAAALPADFNPEIMEMHHNRKKDAPSGTAQRLAEIIAEARRLHAGQFRFGREGETGERPLNEIGVHSLRGGDVVGDHTVFLAGPGERLELTHRAGDRSIFAAGALRAAAWAVTQNPGIYDMQDVLGLKE